MHQYLPFLPFIETFEYSVSPRYFQSNKFHCKKKKISGARILAAPAISRMVRGSTVVAASTAISPLTRAVLGAKRLLRKYKLTFFSSSSSPPAPPFCRGTCLIAENAK